MAHSDNRSNGEGSGLGGLFDGLSNLLRSIGDLAEKGEQLEQLKRMQTGDGREFTVHSSLKFGTLSDRAREPAADTPAAKPFRARDAANTPRRAGRGDGPELREPHVDIFEEETHVLVVAEMPGIAEADLRLDIEGDVLCIAAENELKRYAAEVLLPRDFTRDQLAVRVANGVVEIRCSGAAGDAGASDSTDEEAA